MRRREPPFDRHSIPDHGDSTPIVSNDRIAGDCWGAVHRAGRFRRVDGISICNGFASARDRQFDGVRLRCGPEREEEEQDGAAG